MKIYQKIKKHKNIIGFAFLLSIVYFIFVFDIRIGFTIFENIETIPSNILVLSVLTILLTPILVVIVYYIYVKK